ncbi:MAG TPA: UDP-N-acetylmuramoyl-tripeptide--D-alanyl-D-alanine ligase [Methylothermaceae bacterium]|nr:UDP-N-acetylmuramoyl-tripeptide--D-alanyl-D-alanine ligase [Methylothermaceae bacterium]
MRLSDVATGLQGRLLGGDVAFHGVGIDSRADLTGKLFVALRGERFDGHDFLDQAGKAGAVAAVVERPVASDLPQLQVTDSRRALGQLARIWRQRHFQGTLIAVTGSNGKTTVKEMIAAALGGGAAVLKTQGNLNNDIGVPLTLLRLTREHRFAVIEMGANHGGEIAYSAGLAQPHIAVLTNAGPAHLEGFGSVDGVARAKGEIITALAADGVAVVNAEDRFFDYWLTLAGDRRVVSFGFHRGDVRVQQHEPLVFRAGRFHNRFTVVADGERFEVDLALAGRHNVINALAAIAAALAAGGEPGTVAEGLAALAPVPGRLQPLPLQGGGWLLNDCYNANPASFEAGLETLLALQGEPWVILGAFGEMGPESLAWHRQVGEMTRRRGVRRLLAVGEETKAAIASFGGGGQWFASREALIEAALGLRHPDVCILVKGSRSQRLETVVEALREQ